MATTLSSMSAQTSSPNSNIASVTLNLITNFLINTSTLAPRNLRDSSTTFSAGRANSTTTTANLFKDQELVFEVEEAAEGYNKERLIWILNLIITIIIFAYDIVFLAVYYLFPRVRRNFTFQSGNNHPITSTDQKTSLGGSLSNATNKSEIDVPTSTDDTFPIVGSSVLKYREANNTEIGNNKSFTFWGCPNECCLHLTWGSIVFLLVKVTVDIFFLKIRFLNSSIMVFSIFLLRLLDATLVFNSVYLLILWLKTLIDSEAIENRSICISVPRFMRRAPVLARNDAGNFRVTILPARLTRFIRLLSNNGICLISLAYGIGCALVITFIFNVRGDHLYYYEYQAVKYSLLLQSFHVTINVIVWSCTAYKYNRMALRLGVKKDLSKNVKQIKDLTPTTPEIFCNPLAAPKSDRYTADTTNSYSPQSKIVEARENMNKHFGALPAENLSYYLWITIGNFIVYSPFLWFYLIALLFKPHFIHDMLNMQGLIGFLGTLFDLGACVPVFVATFHDKSLRLSFLDFLYCRYVGGRKSGNLELIT